MEEEKELFKERCARDDVFSALYQILKNLIAKFQSLIPSSFHGDKIRESKILKLIIKSFDYSKHNCR